MIPAMRVEYDGWEICTACWNEPGTSPYYCASGYAILVNPKAYGGGWLSAMRQTAPANRDMFFTDYREAHATIGAVLRAQINALKTPLGKK